MTDLGNSQKALSAWLTGTWLTAGPVACYVGGFSGVGKTTLVRAAAAGVSEFRVVEVEVPPGRRSGDEVLAEVWDQIQPEGTLLRRSARRPAPWLV